MSHDQPDTLDEHPNPEEFLMVERFIKDHPGEYKKRELRKALPERMKYKTFRAIFDHLEDNNKIIRDRDGYVVWIWDPEGVKYYMGQKDLRKW